MIGLQGATSVSLPCCTVEHAGRTKWARFENKTKKQRLDLRKRGATYALFPPSVTEESSTWTR